MAEHEQFAEALALYSLDALEGKERENLEKHLASCTACREELERLRRDGALLAVSIEGAKPPQRSRQRLLAAVTEPRVPASSRRSWWGGLGWAVAAAMLLIVLYLRNQNAVLKRNVSALNAEVDKQVAELNRAQQIVATLTARDAVRATLVSAKVPPQPQGKVFYVRKQGSLIFLANNMPKLPQEKAYELWLIPVNGAPIPAGLFKPDAHGNASVLDPPLPDHTEAKAFAITVEKEAGASTPTMPIVMMGQGE